MMIAFPERSVEQQNFDSRVARLVPDLLETGGEIDLAIRKAVKVVAAAMRAEGAEEERIEPLLVYWRRALSGGDGLAPVKAPLHSAMVETFVEAGGGRPPQLLIEKLSQVETGYRMFFWPNESKHPGNPHVTVELADEKVNISIGGEPRIIAGNEDARGAKAAIRAVGEHHVALLEEWRATRPDDQKVENFKAKRPKKTSKKMRKEK